MNSMVAIEKLDEEINEAQVKEGNITDKKNSDGTIPNSSKYIFVTNLSIF